jgi:hypothetical protein
MRISLDRSSKGEFVTDQNTHRSSYREMLLEHLFVGAVMRHLWLLKIPQFVVLRLVLVVLALVMIAPRLAAQGGPSGALRGPGPSQLFAARLSPLAQAALDTTLKVIRPTHWKRGLLIGCTMGGVGLGALMYALCHDLRETQASCLGPTVGGAALGAVMGGVTGALIGGAFGKPVPADSTAGTP